MNNIELVISESPVSLDFEFVEAKVKPETFIRVTPTYETQILTPQAGTTFGHVIVEPIPDPTAVLEITENGQYNVARIGTVSVNVNAPAQIIGQYYICEKQRITYDGVALTNTTYILTVNAIKSYVQNYWLIFGFEVITPPTSQNDFVAAFRGIDNYSDRVYYWLYNGTTIVSSYSNYPQNVKGNLKSGSVIDVLYIRRA